MIKERNIYKAWVSIQKLTKHTMNLRFMYFKELLNEHQQKCNTPFFLLYTYMNYCKARNYISTLY